MTANLTDENFEYNLSRIDKPILVNFYASWCHEPCKKVFSVLKELEYDYKDKVKFMQVDIDKNEKITQKYSIKGIPALFLFKDNNIVATQIGGKIDKNKLSAFLDSNI